MTISVAEQSVPFCEVATRCCSRALTRRFHARLDLEPARPCGERRVAHVAARDADAARARGAWAAGADAPSSRPARNALRSRGQLSCAHRESCARPVPAAGCDRLPSRGGQLGEHQLAADPAAQRRADPPGEHPVARLNRAVAVRYTRPRAALADIESLLEPLSGYHLLHRTHAAILRNLGRHDEARRADQRALMLTDNPAERALLEQRISQRSGGITSPRRRRVSERSPGSRRYSGCKRPPASGCRGSASRR